MSDPNNSRIDRLEDITATLSHDLSEIKHDMKAIRRELVGSPDGITEGALPRLNRHLGQHDNRLLRLEANGFTTKERERILHVVGFFEGWKLVIAGLIYVLPVVLFILSQIHK
jgi:hypothetical protein